MADLVYSNNGLVGDIHEILYDTRIVDPPVRGYRDWSEHWRRFSSQVWLPVMRDCPRGVQKEMYGRLLRVHERILAFTTAENSVFPCKNYGPVRSQAHAGGLIFLMWLSFRRRKL